MQVARDTRRQLQFAAALDELDTSSLGNVGEHLDRFTGHVDQLIVGHPRDAALGIARYLQARAAKCRPPPATPF